MASLCASALEHCTNALHCSNTVAIIDGTVIIVVSSSILVSVKINPYAINVCNKCKIFTWLAALFVKMGWQTLMKLQGRRIFPKESGKTSLCFYVIYSVLTIQTTKADIGTNVEQKFDQVSTPTLPQDPLNC